MRKQEAYVYKYWRAFDREKLGNGPVYRELGENIARARRRLDRLRRESQAVGFIVRAKATDYAPYKQPQLAWIGM